MTEEEVKFNQGGMSFRAEEPPTIWCSACSGTGRQFVSFICSPETNVCPTCKGNGRTPNPRYKLA